MECYINGIWNYAGFSATGGCTFLGKTRKYVKCTGQKTRKTAIIVDENRIPETEFEKTRKPCRTPNQKNAVLKCENRKTEPNVGQICKTKNPNAPFLLQNLSLGDVNFNAKVMTSEMGQRPTFIMGYYGCRWVNIQLFNAIFFFTFSIFYQSVDKQ